MYMRKFLFLPLLSLLASCAKDDDCSPANVNPDNLEEFYKLKYCSTVVYMVPRA